MGVPKCTQNDKHLTNQAVAKLGTSSWRSAAPTVIRFADQHIICQIADQHIICPLTHRPTESMVH